MVQIDNFGQLIAEVEQQVVWGVKQRTREATKLLLELLRENAPVDMDEQNRKRGPHLADQIALNVREVDDDFEIVITMPGYAKFTEFGTEPHVITPRDPNGYLRFFVAAEEVFRTIVNHPGTPATGWVSASLDEWRPILLDQLAQGRFLERAPGPKDFEIRIES